MSENTVNHLKNKKYLSLKTFYKSGKGIATPVEFVEKSGKIYVNTRKNSWKVKRIRGNLNAQIAPCTIRGKIIGDEMNVTVRILSNDEEVSVAKQALNEKFDKGFNKFLTSLVKFVGKIRFWKKPEERIVLEISY